MNAFGHPAARRCFSLSVAEADPAALLWWWWWAPRLLLLLLLLGDEEDSDGDARDEWGETKRCGEVVDGFAVAVVDDDDDEDAMAGEANERDTPGRGGGGHSEMSKSRRVWEMSAPA